MNHLWNLLFETPTPDQKTTSYFSSEVLPLVKTYFKPKTWPVIPNPPKLTPSWVVHDITLLNKARQRQPAHDFKASSPLVSWVTKRYRLVREILNHTPLKEKIIHETHVPTWAKNSYVEMKRCKRPCIVFMGDMVAR